LLSHSHSLPAPRVVNKHKVADGCGLRLTERYCV
jgi:hypothetical protein